MWFVENACGYPRVSFFCYVLCLDGNGWGGAVVYGRLARGVRCLAMQPHARWYRFCQCRWRLGLRLGCRFCRWRLLLSVCD